MRWKRAATTDARDTTMRYAVLATRATFPDIADRLREHFDVEDNPADTIFNPEERVRRLQASKA
jgi:gluconate 2-dehydrogenase